MLFIIIVSVIHTSIAGFISYFWLPVVDEMAWEQTLSSMSAWS